MTRLYVGAGRAAGIRAEDLVGAITGEAGLDGPPGGRHRHLRPILAGGGARRPR